MKKIGGIVFLVMFAGLMLGCTAPPPSNANSNVNSNANSKPTASAPTADTFMEMEKKANDAYAKGDGAYFETMLADKALMSMGNQRMGKAAIVSMIKTVKCDVKDGIKLSDGQVSKIDNDTYAFTYKNETTGTCTENGKSMEMKPTRASTVWVRSGDSWKAVWHGENEIMGAAAPASNSNSNSNSSATANSTKPNEPAKSETKSANASNSNSNSNANAAASTDTAKLTPSPNTDALVKLHAAGWEAFRNKDAKAFESMIASNYGGVAPDGSYLASRDAAIKEWTGQGTMKCEGITKTSFSDGFAWSISPTVELLLGKGHADGKCDGHPNGDLWNAAVYVKEGDAWKLAYMMESLPRPGM